MSSISQVVTFLDLTTDLLNRVRDSTTVAGTLVLAKRYINISLQDMHINPGNNYIWQQRRGTLITHAPYNTGTLAIAAAARSTVTGTSTTWNTAVTGFGFNNVRAGGKLEIGSSSEIYTVSTVTSDTLLTLESIYTGDAITGQSYTYYEDEYALASDFIRPLDFNSFSSDWNIPIVGAMDFRRSNVRNAIRGRPRIACFIQLSYSGSTSQRPRVVLSPVPDDEYAIPYWYYTSNLAVTSAGVEQAYLVNDTDEPIVPIRFRHAIVFHALYHWYRDIKDDVRSGEAKAEYTDIMTRTIGDKWSGEQRAIIIPMTSRGGNLRQKFDPGNGRWDRFE